MSRGQHAAAAAKNINGAIRSSLKPEFEDTSVGGSSPSLIDSTTTNSRSVSSNLTGIVPLVRSISQLKVVKKAKRSYNWKPMTAWFLWLLAGTVIYAYANRNDWARGFYMAVNVGYSVGWGFPVEGSEGVKYFSVLYVLVGASAVAAALTYFTQAMIRHSKEWYAAALDEERYLDPNSAVSERWNRWLRMNLESFKVLAAWLLWLLALLVFALSQYRTWSFADCLYFAVASLSTGGLVALPQQSPAWHYGTVAFLTATGVPITGLAMTYLAKMFITMGDPRRNEKIIRSKVTITEVEMMKRFGIEFNDNEITPAEFVLLSAVRLGALSPKLIREIDHRFRELDVSRSGTLSNAELLEEIDDTTEQQGFSMLRHLRRASFGSFALHGGVQQQLRSMMSFNRPRAADTAASDRDVESGNAEANKRRRWVTKQGVATGRGPISNTTSHGISCYHASLDDDSDSDRSSEDYMINQSSLKVITADQEDDLDALDDLVSNHRLEDIETGAESGSCRSLNARVADGGDEKSDSNWDDFYDRRTSRDSYHSDCGEGMFAIATADTAIKPPAGRIDMDLFFSGLTAATEESAAMPVEDADPPLQCDIPTSPKSDGAAGAATSVESLVPILRSPDAPRKSVRRSISWRDEEDDAKATNTSQADKREHKDEIVEHKAADELSHSMRMLPPLPIVTAESASTDATHPQRPEDCTSGAVSSPDSPDNADADGSSKRRMPRHQSEQNNVSGDDINSPAQRRRQARHTRSCEAMSSARQQRRGRSGSAPGIPQRRGSDGTARVLRSDWTDDYQAELLPHAVSRQLEQRSAIVMRALRAVFTLEKDFGAP